MRIAVMTSLLSQHVRCKNTPYSNPVDSNQDNSVSDTGLQDNSAMSAKDTRRRTFGDMPNRDDLVGSIHAATACYLHSVSHTPGRDTGSTTEFVERGLSSLGDKGIETWVQ